MPQPLIAGMPPELDLDAGYVVRFQALDPTTGAAVAGVVVNDASIMARNLGDDAGALAVGPWQLVPGAVA